MCPSLSKRTTRVLRWFGQGEVGEEEEEGEEGEKEEEDKKGYVLFSGLRSR
jgi:hypothetical protein